MRSDQQAATPDSLMLRAALAYLEGRSPFGRPVAALPCCAPDPSSPTGCTASWHTDEKRPDHKIGKVPLVPWKQYESRLPTKAEWAEWERRFGPAGYNLGCLAGAVSGVLLLDVDCHDPAADGRRTLRDRGLAAPETPAVRTPSGGLHAWYLYPENAKPGTLRNFQAKANLPGIDARGDGGFGVLPPSVHLTGGVYTWAQEAWALPLAGAPAWLLAGLGRRGTVAAGAIPASPADEWADLWQGPWTPGQRHGTACRLIGHLREHGIGQAEATALLCQWDATACNPPKGADEIAAHVADLYRRGDDAPDLPPAVPWEEAEAAAALLPAALQQRFLGAPNTRAGAAVDALRQGIAPGIVRAWLLDLAEGDAQEAARTLRWATRRAAEGGGRRVG